MGFTVYVDWIDDHQLDRSHVSRATADRLRERMDHCRCLIYVDSEGADHSRWMPWELGYVDARHRSRVAILPIQSQETSNFPVYRGQEYLSLYPYVDKCPPQDDPSHPTLWVNEAPHTYVCLRSWLTFVEPYDRP